MMDISTIIKYVKELQKKRLAYMEKANPVLLNEPSIDHNMMGPIMYFSHFLKTMKLVFIIFNISYFVGMGWLIYCRVIESLKEGCSITLSYYIDPEEDHGEEEEGQIFINKFELFKMDGSQ